MQLVLEEAHRSIHDALCAIRCLVKKRFLIAGGGAPETEVDRELMLHETAWLAPMRIVSRLVRSGYRLLPNFPTLSAICGRHGNQFLHIG